MYIYIDLSCIDMYIYNIYIYIYIHIYFTVTYYYIQNIRKTVPNQAGSWAARSPNMQTSGHSWFPSGEVQQPSVSQENGEIAMYA